jgi:hypothetical protein
VEENRSKKDPNPSIWKRLRSKEEKKKTKKNIRPTPLMPASQSKNAQVYIVSWRA